MDINTLIKRDASITTSLSFGKFSPVRDDAFENVTSFHPQYIIIPDHLTLSTV